MSNKPSGGGGRWFKTTRWSLVHAAADSGSPEYRNALSDLCTDYWLAVYAFIRSRGNDPDAAQDLTQGFFTQLLDKKFLQSVQQSKGKFRSFLLACVKHFMANEWDREKALKRGGGTQVLPLAMGEAESFVEIEPVDTMTPEKALERVWARTLLRRVLAILEEQATERGELERFRCFAPHLLGEFDSLPYEEIAEKLGTSQGAVRVGIHNMRKKFGVVLREKIVHTVDDPDSIEREIRFLIASLKD